jgi:hypothetical protein
MEDLLSYYANKLDKSEDIPSSLTQFYCTALKLQSNRDILIMFSKLTRMYGGKVVFKAIVDVYDMKEVDLNNIYPLLTYFCNKGTSVNDTSSPSLDSVLNDNLTKIEELKEVKLVIPNPFEETDSGR